MPSSSEIGLYRCLEWTVHLERWYDGDIPDGYRVALSPKGYTTDSIAFDWIQHLTFILTLVFLVRQSRVSYFWMAMDPV